MALQDAILAALARGEASGYDLAKGFDVTVANFWAATAQQLYRELDRMERAGLVTARVIEQTTRPNKRIFSLTRAGEEALSEFTRRPPRPTAIRDELLVQVEALDMGDLTAIRTHVADLLESSRAKLARYERRREHMLDSRTEVEHLARGVDLGPWFTLARGISFERENVRWCSDVLKALGSSTT